MRPDTTPSSLHPPPDAAPDHARRRKLRIARRRATGLLLLSAVAYVLATRYGQAHEGLAWVAAFAEAAMVGALADWYAVVALFRHPLGLRLPHTAIIPRNKDRIADNLGEFVQGEFFSHERIVAAVDAIDPARYTADWLRREDHARQVANALRGALRQLDAVLDAAEVRHYLGRAVSRQILSTDLAEMAGRMLASLTRRGRHQEVLDVLLRQLAAQLARPELQDSLNVLLAEKLPLYFRRLKSWAGNKSGAFTARTLAELAEDVERDPDHPLRRHLDAWLRETGERLRTDPDYRLRLEQVTRKLAGHPALSRYLDEVWREWRTALSRDLAADESRIEDFLAGQVARLGEVLAQDDAMRGWLNDRARRHLPALVERYRHRLGRYIADKMKEWNERELVEKLELNIGADLQYIRINGALVGGLVGLLLHAVSLYL